MYAQVDQLLLKPASNTNPNVEGVNECRWAVADTIYCIELCQSLQFSHS